MNEYLFDLKAFIREEPAETFALKKKTADEILGDGETMDALWTTFQKGIQDYDREPEDAFHDALRDVLGIDKPEWHE